MIVRTIANVYIQAKFEYPSLVSLVAIVMMLALKRVFQTTSTVMKLLNGCCIAWPCLKTKISYRELFSLS
jgi:hypothetical protein